MPLTIPLGDWHELTVDKITSLFLYGVDPPPAELFDRIRDQNAPNNDITVTLDANSFMSDPDSPARYALPVLSPFVTAFFSNLSFFFPDLAGIQGSATVADLISNYHVDATLFRFAIRQAYIATDSQDYPARTYIWNSEGFTLSQDTKFVFSDPSDPNFVPHIENLRVLPFDDNFDFGSKDLNSAITAEPNNATAYVKRAEVWMRKGLTDENLDLAVAADPANGLTRRLLDSALNYKQTLPTLRRVFEEQNETEARRKANAPARKGECRIPVANCCSCLGRHYNSARRPGPLAEATGRESARVSAAECLRSVAVIASAVAQSKGPISDTSVGVEHATRVSLGIVVGLDYMHEILWLSRPLL